MFHQTIIVGRLGKDPEGRYTPKGDMVTSFSVAVNEQYNTKDGEVKKTIWYRVQVWGKAAEACQKYLKKGAKVLVEGRLVADDDTGGPRIWTDSSGESRASFEIAAKSVKFLSEKSDTSEEQEEMFE